MLGDFFMIDSAVYEILVDAFTCNAHHGFKPVDEVYEPLTEQIEYMIDKDNGFLSLSGLYSDDDIIFLRDMCRHFPRVAQGLAVFAHQDPEKRLPLAVKVISKQLRSGWVRRLDLDYSESEVEGGKKAETVAGHCTEAAWLYRWLYKDDANSTFGAEVMQFHDIGEAIIGDFTPHDDISKDEKGRLEALGVRLLTQNMDSGDVLLRHVHHCMSVYEREDVSLDDIREDMLAFITCERDAGRVLTHQEDTVQYFESLYDGLRGDVGDLHVRTKDCDLVQMSVRAAQIVLERHAQQDADESHWALSEFWGYIHERLELKRTHDFFEEMCLIYDGARYEGVELEKRSFLNLAMKMTDERQEFGDCVRASAETYRKYFLPSIN